MASNNTRILSQIVKRLKASDRSPLEPLLDEYLLARDASPNRYIAHTINTTPRLRPGGRLSPSTIGGCQRQAALRFLGVRGQRKVEPERELVFDRGNWIHHQWDVIFKDMEAVLGPVRFKVLSNETAVRIPKLFVAGSSDNLLAIEQLPYVEDTKSIRSDGFDYVYRQQAPIEEHVDQVHPYMVGHQVPRALLFYDNKNDSRTKSFVVKFDRKRWDEIKGWCARVLDYMRREELPPMHIDCHSGNFLFERCPYAWLCYGSRSERSATSLAYNEFEGLKAAWIKGNRAFNDDAQIRSFQVGGSPAALPDGGAERRSSSRARRDDPARRGSGGSSPRSGSRSTRSKRQRAVPGQRGSRGRRAEA